SHFNSPLEINVEDFEPGAIISGLFNVSTTEDWNDTITAIANGGKNKNYIIHVIGDDPIPVTGTTTPTFGDITGIQVSLRGEGGILTLSGEGSIFRIKSDQTVILRDITLKGHASNTASLIHVDGGVLKMNGGGISDNTVTGGSGGGVCVKNSGIFTMNGGVISGNNAINGGGGGVYVENHGIFTMNGGEISTNTAKGNNGGGVGVGKNGTFNMMKKDGEIGEISTNIVDGNSGGGVGVYQGTFYMEDGNINDNKTIDGQGGGVVLYGGTFTMECGNIFNNQVTNPGGGQRGDGGGVYVMTTDGVSGYFAMKGGVIYGNKAATSRYGGGVCLDNATFRISAGTIYGSENTVDVTLRNTSTNGGAALHFFSTCTAQRGTFDGDTWKMSSGGSWTTAQSNTIKVENGLLVQQ
ncbi:MAG: hypothetical protein LBI28_06820, partial [Treponema sp.]|nr:hypothetical protein [Treponema sp.]